VTPRSAIRVLIAEDDPSVRSALSACLADDAAFELVASAVDADGAIEAAWAAQPDVALVDVRMPGGGVMAAQGIKRRSPETRMLAFSAYDDRATVLEMLEAGVVGYLVKGSSIESIMDSLTRAAAGQGSLSVEVTGDVIDELVGQLHVRRKSDDRRRTAEARIRRAVENGALSIVFQPIVALAGGEPIGLEALSRFKAPPERDPEEWFAEASEVGLRRDLELAAVAAAVRELPQLPEGLFLSVNASPETLCSAAFRKLMHRIDASRVVVELTEHAPVENYAAVNTAVAHLRGDGVRLAIDDAGAGFASLRHILRLAPELIKLDRTLINRIEQDRSRQALAAGLISFASKIDATIVAEGIEREEEVEALLGLGVAFGQGFYFAKPAALPVLARTS
jgi:EAL domain-containing protein (putative c-di-GMP-specific phosphodiesterase class I)/DNA-binding NarL/FixJ family response regulator